MIIAVDFDGTIVKHKFPLIGEEREEAIGSLKELQSKGHKIIIWTCREDRYLIEMCEWLKSRGFTPDAVNENYDKNLGFGNHKIYADIYIDDRNFPFGLVEWSMMKAMILSGVVK